jgi:class 3 adenylate cyclase
MRCNRMLAQMIKSRRGAGRVSGTGRTGLVQGGEPVMASAQAGKHILRSYTPPHLANTILMSRSALTGERKHVTVLFADLEDSTALAQAVDPEVLHEVLDGVFELMLAEVHRLEGTINQFTGDGIMALFGAPIAHEDHAIRALHAALGMQRAFAAYAGHLRRTRGLAVALRIGLHAGPVVVGKIGNDLRMDYTAQGFTTHLAARLQQLAGAGTIYLSETVQQQAAGFFRFDDLGAFALQGITAPVWPQPDDLPAGSLPATGLVRICWARAGASPVAGSLVEGV